MLDTQSQDDLFRKAFNAGKPAARAGRGAGDGSHTKPMACLPLRLLPAVWNRLAAAARVLRLTAAVERCSSLAAAMGIGRRFNGLLNGLRNFRPAAAGRVCVLGPVRFVQSRRWLATAFAVSVAILLLIVIVKPLTLRDLVPDEVASTAVAFQELRPALTEPSLRQPPQTVDRSADGAVFLNARKHVPSAVSQPPVLRAAGTSEPEPFDAIRTVNFESDEGRGAWLTGTIEEVGDEPPTRTARQRTFQNSPR